MSKKFTLVLLFFCLVLSSLSISRVAVANGNATAAPMWTITDIVSLGPLDISQDYSQEWGGEEGGSIVHSLQAEASDQGRTRIVNVLSVSPVASGGARFWSGTYIGYDSSGGELSGKEVGGAMICDYQHACDQGNLAVDMAAGYEIVKLTQGVVHSNIKANSIASPAVSYNLSASSTDTQGDIKSGVAVASFSDDSTQNYEQHIRLHGNFRLNHHAEVN